MVSDDFSCVQLGLLFRVRLAKVLPHTHSAHATSTATAAGCSRHIVTKTREKKHVVLSSQNSSPVPIKHYYKAGICTYLEPFRGCLILLWGDRIIAAPIQSFYSDLIDFFVCKDNFFGP